jgi:hypothetical protein
MVMEFDLDITDYVHCVGFPQSTSVALSLRPAAKP